MTSSLDFGSLLNLSPRGTANESQKSRSHCNALKQGQATVLEKMALAVKKRYDEGLFRNILGPDRILVPVPGHAPLVTGGLWVPKLLAEQFVAIGLGKKVVINISRLKAVTKSSTAKWGTRPTVSEHYDSLKLNQTEIFSEKQVTLIDDVLTKGSTAYACYALLRRFSPELNVSCFAIFKTQGYISDIKKLVEPTEGKITYNNSKVNREP